MANLSNINNILRISSSGVGLNKDNTGPSELDIESAGADMIDMTRTDLKTYRFAISGSSDFSIFDVAANDDRLTISSAGNATFANRVSAGESFNSVKDGADTVADGPFFALKNAAGTRQYINQLDASNNIDYWYYNGSTWTQTISLLNDGGATFAGSVSATNFIGPGQGLDNLLPLGVYSTVPGTAGVLIATNIVSNNYGFLFGTIKLEQFNQTSKQTIEFSATVGTTGNVITKAATADIAITMKLFNVGGYWYIHLPMPSTYVTVSAYIYTGSGYQGQGKGFNEISSITMNPVPANPVGSADIVANVYLTTGGSSPWFKNGNDIYNSNSANVGIGTSGPIEKLQVRTNITTDNSFQGINVNNFGQTGTRAGISFKCYDWVQSAIWHGRGASAAYNGALVLGTNPNTSDLTVGGVTGRMWILNNGDVGIATDQPTAKLDINGTVRYRGSIYNQLSYQVTGSYSANTWYDFATSATLTQNGIYIIVAYIEDFTAGGGNYYTYVASTNFYWSTIGTNRPTAFNFPPMLGTGHATGVIPSIRVTQELGSSGALSRLQWQSSYTYTNLQNAGGKILRFDLKRIGA